MNKKELVREVAAVMENGTHKIAADAIDSVFEVIEQAMLRGESINITGFGAFEVRERAERTGFNPQKGENMLIPAKKAPVFKAAKGLKERVRNIK